MFQNVKPTPNVQCNNNKFLPFLKASSLRPFSGPNVSDNEQIPLQRVSCKVLFILSDSSFRLQPTLFAACKKCMCIVLSSGRNRKKNFSFRIYLIVLTRLGMAWFFSINIPIYFKLKSLNKTRFIFFQVRCPGGIFFFQCVNEYKSHWRRSDISDTNIVSRFDLQSQLR